jgi:hypothetical protein
MPTITSAASGNWSAPATWVGGIAPVDGDKVVIAVGHTVTVDTVVAGGDGSVTESIPNAAINVSGTLSFSRAASTSLTCNGLLLFDVNSVFDMGTIASPISLPHTADLILNKQIADYPVGLMQVAPTTTSHNVSWTVCGDTSRIRNAYLLSDAAAAQATLTLTSASHKWVVGDTVMLFPTTRTATAGQSEFGTILSIAGATITLSANLSHLHMAGSPACNMNSNLRIRPYSATSTTRCYVQARFGQYMNTAYYVFDNAQFQDMGRGALNTPAIKLYDSPELGTYGCSVNACAAYGALPTTLFNAVTSVAIPVSNSAIYGSLDYNYGVTTSYGVNTCIVGHMLSGSSNQTHTGCFIGLNLDLPVGEGTFVNCTISGSSLYMSGAATFIDCDIGYTYGWNSLYGDNFWRLTQAYSYNNASTNNCLLNANLLIPASQLLNIAPRSILAEYNINNDTTLQSLFTSNSHWQRDNTTTHRSVSSYSCTPFRANTPDTETQQFLIAANQTVKIIGSIQVNSLFYNVGAWVAPSISLVAQGLSAVSHSASAASNGVWEDFSLSFTNTGTYPKVATITFTVNDQAGTGGTVWFDGVPNSPFINVVRHYGYQFDQVTPNATVNGTVQASEATAIAYTGISVAGTPSASPVTITGNTTFQKLYDYTQAWSCANLANAIPLTGSGSAGSPSLSLNANLTVNATVTLNGAGSILAGSSTILADWLSVGGSYTYTGGAWGQLTTIPSFNGGQLNIGAAAAYNFVMAGSTIISMTPAASSTYNLAGSTFTGTADLRNTSAFAITVHIPTGTGYITTNNTGGAITVSAPALYQSVTVNGLVANSRIRIYDTIAAVELYNGIVAGTSYTWTDTVAAAANRTIGLRASNVQNPSSVPTAYIFIDTAIGTCGTTTATAAVSYLASQAIDSNYNANGIDGAVITDCSIVTTALHVDITSGSATIQHIYAFMVYWLYTAIGIADQTTEMTSRNTADYVVNSGFTIKNTSSPSVPLLVTGGNVSMSSGSDIALLDTTGGSIYMKSATVVPYSAGASATIAIVQQGLDANGYTTSRAPKIDNLDAAVSILPTEVWGKAIEGMTAEQILRVTLAALAGKRAGLGTATENYMAQDGITPRITFAETDAFGNGTPTLNGGVP